MNIFLDAHIKILESITQYQVSFMLVGGYAVNFHGYNRVTGDMDLWIKPDNENKTRLLAALQDLGFDDDGISIIRNWDFSQPQLFSILDKPYQVEFMTHITGIKYELAEKMVIHADIDGVHLPVIHLNNLIQNKKASGRTKDLSDAEYLEKIRDMKK